MMNPVLKIKQIAQSQARKAALRRAYTAFAEQYHDWTQYLFDAHFVNTRVADLLDRSTLPGVTSIVNAWARQMTWSRQEARRQQIARLLPAASHFLQLVEAEMGAGNVVEQPIPQTV